MSVSIPYPKVWSFGEILTSSDLNAEFAAVTGITGLTTANFDSNAAITNSQLAVGAALNNALTQAITGGLVIQGVETTVVQFASMTTRGGRIVLAGFGGLALSFSSTATGTLRWRVYRGVSVRKTIDQPVNFGPASTVSTPVALPLFSEAPAAGSYVYKITAEIPGGPVNVALVSDATNPGEAYLIEFS